MNTQQRNISLIEEHYEAFWSGDEERMRTQISPDFIDHGAPGAPKGVESVLAHAWGLRTSFPDMKVTIERAVAQRDQVAVHAKWRGAHKGPFLGMAATHKEVAFEGMVFWRIAKGVIVERWAMLDTPSIVQQLQP